MKYVVFELSVEDIAAVAALWVDRTTEARSWSNKKYNGLICETQKPELQKLVEGKVHGKHLHSPDTATPWRKVGVWDCGKRGFVGATNELHYVNDLGEITLPGQNPGIHIGLPGYTPTPSSQNSCFVSTDGQTTKVHCMLYDQEFFDAMSSAELNSYLDELEPTQYEAAKPFLQGRVEWAKYPPRAITSC